MGTSLNSVSRALRSVGSSSAAKTSTPSGAGTSPGAELVPLARPEPRT
ncbi:MAG: hypothetical protein ACRDZW_06785 [Acidimicrobiales bacterium]